jgi:hypothetical protein
MSTNLVFANATGVPFDLNVVTTSGNQSVGSFECAPGSTSSGIVSGSSSYKVLFTPGANLSSPMFAGDTEITFVVFTQPITESDEPVAEADSAAAPPAEGEY